MNLTRNGLIVLISVIFVAGAGTAYAGIVLPTITLAGDVTITGDTTLQGDMTCNNCVESGDLGFGAVGSAQLAFDAVDEEHIEDGAVGSVAILDNSVTSIDIAGGAVGSAQLAFDAVDEEHIEDGAVGSVAILDNSVTSTDIADGTITVADLEVPPKYGLVFTAGGDNYPLGSTSYLGLGDVFTSSGDAAFFIPFDSTITDIRAGASNTSPDTTVTYTVKNLGGNAVSFGCSAVGVLSCSNTGSVDVDAGQKLFIEITGGCIGTCPTNISDVRVSIGLLPR